jgi:hypothetical protein
MSGKKVSLLMDEDDDQVVDVKTEKALNAILNAIGTKKIKKEISHVVAESENTNTIILPKGMSKLVASDELRKQYEAEEQVTEQRTEFAGWNWQDVLVAVKKVTSEQFGWMNAQNTGWFGTVPPTEIDIVVDVKNGKNYTERAFWGKFKISYWDNAPCMIQADEQGVISISVHAKGKFRQKVTTYFNLIREHLSKNSIYRGRNISVTKDAMKRLVFTIIENKPSSKIVLNKEEELVVSDFVIDSLKEPGKRTYLFTGSYGTGKTETAMRVGFEAVEQHGMSFFYIKDASLFPEVLTVSKNYQPCLIFMEDVDEIGGGVERDTKMNNILNILDGVETKGNSLNVIFTTNHAKRINQALRRPGRIDLVVKFDNPTIETKAKIMEVYFNDLEGYTTMAGEYGKTFVDVPVVENGVVKVENGKTVTIQKEVEGYLGLIEIATKMDNDVAGAVVAEICKRAVKLANKKGGISPEIVLSAAASIKYQTELMAEPVEELPKAKQFVNLFGQAAQGQLNGK